MKRWRWMFADCAAAAAILMGLGASPAAGGNPPEIAPPLPRPRVFAASVFSVDQILARPFDRDVPMGCTGDRVWASSPQGWAFRDDDHWLYLTNLSAFDLEIRDDSGWLAPAEAIYYITCDKFITSSDCLVSLVRAHNPTGSVQTIYVDPLIASGRMAGSWHWESDSGPIDRADGLVRGHVRTCWTRGSDG